MMVDNDFSKFGMKLKIFAILTLLVAALGLLESYVVDIGISGLVAIPLLIFQILIIVGAKKCAKTYNKPQLNTFATLMIVSLLLSFASSGIIVGMTFYQVLSTMRGGGSVVNILPIMIAGEVISVITLAAEVGAWFYMLGFFDHLEEVDARARGKPGAILAIVGGLISIASSLIIGIPSIIMNPTIDIENITLVMTPAQIIAGALLNIATNVASVVGYFILSAVFIQLGSLKPPTFPVEPTATSWGRQDSLGSPAPGAWNGDIAPVSPEANAPDTGKCPFCGASLASTDPRALFCGECGAKLPGRG